MNKGNNEMKTMILLGVLAPTALLAACGGGEEEATGLPEEANVEEVELPATMPTPGEITAPADGEPTVAPDVAVTPTDSPAASPTPMTGQTQ